MFLFVCFLPSRNHVIAPLTDVPSLFMNVLFIWLPLNHNDGNHK